MLHPTCAALLLIGTADILFLSLAILAGLVLVLLSNPLTTWVTKLMNKDQDKREGPER